MDITNELATTLQEHGIDTDGLKATLTKHRRKIIVTITLGSIVLFLVFGSAMLVNAVILGSLTTLGLMLTYIKMPAKFKEFVERHKLLVDIAAAIMTYLTFGSTVTSLIAAAIVGLLTDALFALTD